MMRVAIAGAGGVGRSIAAELIGNGHEVLLIDRETRAIAVDDLPEADWLLADACELASLEDARLADFETVVAATGDDKVNLVVALLAKEEFGVARTVARINDPRNEWLFTEAWGVDVAVSPPRLIASLVDDTAGGAVGSTSLPEADLLEFALDQGGRQIGRRLADLAAELPPGVVPVAVVRAGRAGAPQPDTVLQVGDDLVLLATGDQVDDLSAIL
ncbi:trk system potassium uptake protein TrkA [Murinocardiopsis flavida]|uniref:Trk system potassium uptake protein TrkA n=2 Tax=Murinocardiopsis flavida TaxID=645275 RepID=A0A2P8CH11_9ACTN|nr:trk system potassium uptake protein TrkA [Murinocardiopsis flavida]